MNKKILIGGILGLTVVIAIVAFIFLGKNKDNTLANNVANGNVEDTIKELKDYTNMSEDEMREELNTEVDLSEREDLVALIDSANEPIIAEVREEDNKDLDPNGMKYYGRDEEGNLIEVVDPILGMTDEEADEASKKLLEAAEAVDVDEEEYERLILDAKDLIPDIPPENYIDQDNIDAGWEADIDPETGEVNYWNPNTVDDDRSGDITGWQDTGGPEIDDSKTQSTTDAGYLPEDPNDYIYGN